MAPGEAQAPATTPLHKNPFAILGASIRDDKRRIIQLADEKSLEADSSAHEEARATLTNPRQRLTAEISWLPGVSPNRADQLLKSLSLRSRDAWRDAGDLPALAKANLAASSLTFAIHDRESDQKIAARIMELSELAESISAEEVLRELNEDRTISGFPSILDGERVDEELSLRRACFSDTIRDALNTLPTESLVSVVTLIAEAAALAEDDFPELVERLIDTYEHEAHEFLSKEGDGIVKLISTITALVPRGAEAINALIEHLGKVTRNWDRIAQPIQLSAMARGVAHAKSNDLGTALRNLALHLHNEHGMTDEAHRITALLREIFSELPELAEKLDEDVSALEGIKLENAQWANEINFSTEIGLLLKKKFSISTDVVTWHGRSYPLDSITRVRWGGLRHSVNGIPTGTTYTIAFGDNASEAVMEFGGEKLFGECIDRLWRAVGVRLLLELLAALKAGRTITFGACEVTDTGITVPQQKFFGKGERVCCNWNELRIWTADGSFFAGSKTDRKAFVALSYIVDPNTHVLEHAISMAFKKPGLRRLSDILIKS